MPPSTPSSPLSPVPPTIQLSTSTTHISPSLPPPTTRALLSHLKTTNAIPELAETLLDSLSRTGWTDRLRALAVELLHSGTCTTYPELLHEVLRRAKVPKPEQPAAPQTNGVGGKKVNGVGVGVGVGGKTTAKKTPNGVVNGSGSGTPAISVREGWFDEDGLPDVRIPTQCVEAGMEFLKERIADAVEVVDGDEDSD